MTLWRLPEQTHLKSSHTSLPSKSIASTAKTQHHCVLSSRPPQDLILKSLSRSVSVCEVWSGPIWTVGGGLLHTPCHLWSTSVSHPQLSLLVQDSLAAQLFGSGALPPHPHPARLSLSWLWLPVSFSRAQPAFDRLLLAASARTTQLYIALPAAQLWLPLALQYWFPIRAEQERGRPTISDNYNVLFAPSSFPLLCPNLPVIWPQKYIITTFNDRTNRNNIKSWC